MTSAKTQTTAPSHLSFEAALAELEQIVRGLENGQMKLEEAISAYERGDTLRRHCEKQLEEAETRVKAIVQKTDGSFSEEAFDPADKPTPTPRKKAPAKSTAKPQNDGWSAGPGLDNEIPF